LIELNDPQYIPAAFILAVMLERKRGLKVKEQLVREGQRVFIYEHPRSGDVFTVVDPNLQLNQLDAVQRDVAALLEHGFRPEAAIPAPAPSTAEASPSDDRQAQPAGHVPSSPSAEPGEGRVTPPVAPEVSQET